MLSQVTYRFPTDTEIRYLERPPGRGDRVRGRRGEFFIVLDVEREGDAYVVRCVTPSEYARDLRRVSRRLSSIADDMAQRARELMRRSVEHRARMSAERDVLTPPRRQR